MDAFVSRKRKRVEEPKKATAQVPTPPREDGPQDEEESTDFKLACLTSLHASLDESTLLEALLASEGSVEQASAWLSQQTTTSPKKRPAASAVGFQSSLSSYRVVSQENGPAKKQLVKKGQTLHLYSPEDIEAHTPCSIIHNFLPAKQADDLLVELLAEADTYKSIEFKLFDKVVWSPHTFSFYVNSIAEAEAQKTEYIYDGRKVEDVRQSTPSMLAALPNVESTVNLEIARRILTFYPGGRKLKYQSPHAWRANTAFVNCYDGGKESVGYHSDQLTYLGPRAVIGSLSLGVSREFRVRKIATEDISDRADHQGQISIHLPHNSLLVMHAEMQEEWKHCIAPSATITPHPVAGNKRINVTYRYYKPGLHPRYTPRCRCGVPGVLRCATRKRESRGRYMWMCHAGYVPGQEGCTFFQWAEFDDDGEPPWAKKVEEKEKGDVGGK